MSVKMEVGEKLTGYDTCDIGEAEIEYRTNENEDYFKEKLDDYLIENDLELADMTPEEIEEAKKECKEEIEEKVWSDTETFTFAFESMVDDLSELMQERNKGGHWLAKVNNFGWRNLDGRKQFDAEDGKDFLREILPECDCTFNIFDYGEGQGFAIKNFHHDSPTGEWYYIIPMKDVEGEMYELYKDTGKIPLDEFMTKIKGILGEFEPEIKDTTEEYIEGFVEEKGCNKAMSINDETMTIFLMDDVVIEMEYDSDAVEEIYIQHIDF